MRKLHIIVIFFLLGAFSCEDYEMGKPEASTQADYTYEVSNDYYAPCTVTFTNKSINANAYQWDFGNGQSSSDENPSVSFQEPGIYKITLTVSGPNDDLYYNTLKKTVTLVVKDPTVYSKTLYFTERSSMMAKYIVLDTTLSEPVVQEFGHAVLSKPYGVTVDTIREKVYVSDFSLGNLYRYDLDGDNVETLAEGIDGGPWGMVVIEDKIYWGGEFGIFRADLDGSNQEVHVDMSTGIPEMPEGLVYDPIDEKFYFANDKYNDVYAGGIWSCNFDGSEMTLVVPNVYSQAIDIDVKNRRIYYADKSQKAVYRCDLDGSNTGLMGSFSGDYGVYGIAVDPDGGKLYWGLINTRSEPDGIIMRSNLDGSEREDWVTGVNPYALAIDHVYR